MKVAIYIRVSTEEQAKEGYSISAQKQRLKSFCISQNWEVAGIYIDEGVSAKDMNRPELQNMIKDIEKKKIDCVLVWRLDRLTRSVFDLYKLLETFEQYGCKFKSATEVFDTTTAVGRMFITIVAAIAQWERENLGERVSMGITEKARQGLWPLNFRPYGYNLDLKTGMLSINESEANVLRKIYDMYESGYGISNICKYLNKNGITTANGNKWGAKPLSDIIKSPVYAGHIYWNGEVYKGKHEPIISEERYKTIQKLVKNRTTTPPRRISSDFIFSGKLRCPDCGSMMVGKRAYYKTVRGEKRNYKYYKCISKRDGRCNNSFSFMEDVMEKSFLEFLEKQNFSHLIANTAEKGEKELNNNDNINVDALKKELDKIENRKKKWQYAWVEELIDEVEFSKRMEEERKKEKEILSQLEQLKQAETEYIERKEIEEALKDIKKNWEQLTELEKKQLLDLTIEQIHYKPIRIGFRNFVEITGIDFI